MKRIFAVLMALLIIFSLSACGEDAKSLNGTKENIKTEIESEAKWVLVKATSCGNVLSTDNTIELASGQKWTGNCHDSQSWVYTYTYDINGNMLTDTKSCSNGDSEKEEWTYNKSGDKLSYIVYKNECKSRESYWTYHENGKKATYKYIQYKMSDSTIYNITEEEYDVDGNIIKSYGKYADGREIFGGAAQNSQSVYQNTTDKDTTEKKYDKEGRLQSLSNSEKTVIYHYDKNDKVVLEEIEYKKLGGLISNIKREWDSFGNQIKTTVVDIKNGVETIDYIIEYQRDNKGNLLFEKRTNYNPDGTTNCNYEISYEYKNNGKVFSKKCVDYDSNCIKTYEYDENGNLANYSVQYTAAHASNYGFTAAFEYKKL